MASDIAMMLFISALAGIAVLIMARIPDAPGHYTDPAWIVATMSAVMMTQGFYVVIWLCRTFRILERLLFILTGVKPEEAKLTFQGTLRRMRQLFEELTTGP